MQRVDATDAEPLADSDPDGPTDLRRLIALGPDEVGRRIGCEPLAPARELAATTDAHPERRLMAGPVDPSPLLLRCRDALRTAGQAFAVYFSTQQAKQKVRTASNRGERVALRYVGAVHGRPVAMFVVPEPRSAGMVPTAPDRSAPQKTPAAPAAAPAPR